MAGEVAAGVADANIALGILQAAIALAGLVLIYAGFLSAKAAEYNGNRRGDRFTWLARLGFIPVLYAFVCTLMAARVLHPGGWASLWAANWLLLAFEILVALTAVYAIMAAFLSTS